MGNVGMSKRTNLTQIELHKRLAYNNVTGQFFWKIPPRGKLFGDEAGSVDKLSGYVTIYIDGIQYKAHRLAWLYVYGEFPKKCTDHINENRQDNRISNLRDVRSGTNLLNRAKADIGVSYRKDRDTWKAHFGINCKNVDLGSYPTKEEALAARHGAKKLYSALGEP